MRVLLVTTTNHFSEKLNVLSPELEYCAIVVDELESAKEILGQVGLSQDLLQPMSNLRECVESLNYDYVLCVQDDFYDYKNEILQKYNVPMEKIVCFAGLHNTATFEREHQLRYYREHSQDFEMFATGISTAFEGIDHTQFKRKLFKFAKSSQDLYYDYSFAKSAISCGGGKTRYALIGLAPYSFHYDLSQVFSTISMLLTYLVAFNDLHNFYMPADVYKKFLREDWLNQKLPLNSFIVTQRYFGAQKKSMDQKDIETETNHWHGKYYPKTRDEYIKILDDYLTLCETNNIRPVMFMVPTSEKYMANFNKKLLEEFYILVEQALRKHPDARFFEGWKLQDFTYADFHDHAHLNVYGSAKFSTHFNDFIQEIDKSYWNLRNYTCEDFYNYKHMNLYDAIKFDE